MYNINMKSLERFFASRKTVLILISLILLSVITGYIFPQRFLVSQFDVNQWKVQNPLLASLYETFGLDHIYTTRWFTALLFLFLASLILSTMDQIIISRRRTSGRRAINSKYSFNTDTEMQIVEDEVKKAGYMPVFRDEGEVRCVKYPWGYWGNVMLHLGLVLVIVSSLVAALFQQRGAADFVEGEVFEQSSSWQGEETGLLVSSLVLPGDMRFGSIKQEFWENDDLKQLTSEVTFISPDGVEEQYSLAVNRTANHQGVKVYQGTSFGNAFYIDIAESNGSKEGLILAMNRPSDRKVPSYKDFSISNPSYVLKAKYFADAEKKSMVSGDPLLVLRLVKGEEVIGQLPLKMGEQGSLGPYAVKLVKAAPWTKIIFAKVPGITGIFTGFVIVIIGTMLTYFMSPREFFLQGQNGSVKVDWASTRFDVFYIDEFEEMKARLT